MSKATEQFEYWLNNDYFDQETKNELLAIRNNADEVEDRFYRELEFGTGGLRGVIGAGTNRMNKYTVRKATQGLANSSKSTAELMQQRRALLFPMTAESFHLSLQRRQLFVLQQTELRLM
jgi:hypothetical protein